MLVVFDLHRAAKEPVFGGHVSSGLILFEERCIYLRYTNSPAMEETLIHEMAHAATTGEHGQEWLYEMARLKAAGAPVPDWELEGVVAEEPQRRERRRERRRYRKVSGLIPRTGWFGWTNTHSWHPALRWERYHRFWEPLRETL